jgi:hypothetical protein
VARRPRIIGNFLTTIAGHDLGERIEPFQRMRLYREYPPIVVRRMGPCIHTRTLCFALFWFKRNRFEGTDRKDERSLGKNVQRNLANSRTVKVRNAVADVTNGRGAEWRAGN